MHTRFQFITRARLTLIDDTTKRPNVKSLQHKMFCCTMCCLKSTFHTCTPSSDLELSSHKVMQNKQERYTF